MKNLMVSVLFFLPIFALSSLQATHQHTQSIPLFNAYPALQKNIPHISLGNFPTPVYQCKKLGALYGKTQVYIKCDNESGNRSGIAVRVGGNKVRKLEFLLADVVARGVREVVTFGGAGSNHALATAAYAHHLGLAVHLFLADQPNSHIVRRNLLLNAYYGARMTYAATEKERYQKAAAWCEKRSQFCTMPSIIPVGGSSACGIVGFVNAAFELKEQIDAGILPEPRYILVPCGSCGTTAGLMLGCKAAGLRSVVIPIAIEPNEYTDALEDDLVRKYTDTAEYLAQYEPSFAQYALTKNDIQVIHDYQGTQYGLFTETAQNALKKIEATEGITLDGVYSAKAACCLLELLACSGDEPILFWNTFFSDPCTDILAQIKYTQLPQDFWRYFTDPVQQLDRYCLHEYHVS